LLYTTDGSTPSGAWTGIFFGEEDYGIPPTQNRPSSSMGWCYRTKPMLSGISWEPMEAEFFGSRTSKPLYTSNLSPSPNLSRLMRAER
jgi:hypothetical protein